MSRGLPYDSDEGRAYAAAITAVMTGEAYAQSARIARDHGGPFAGYERNREPFLRVMRKHRDACRRSIAKHVPADLYAGAKQAWDEAVELGEDFGYRNAQATVLAPTGTIGFMMDCDTTGVEPDIALVKYKKLVGGGLMKIVNGTVPMALAKLGYTAPEIEAIVHHIDEHETIEGAPFLKDEHLPVFDCAFKAGQRRAVDPLHGPHPDDGRDAAVHLGRDQQDGQRAARGDRRGHRAGLHRVVALGAKAISIYRDGSKRTQPLNTSKAQVADTRNSGAGFPARREVVKEVVKIVETPKRRKLPDERHAITHKFDIAGHEGYITVGLFEDGTPGEIFLTMAKEGSTISGFADAFAQAISYALQYGVPLQVLVDKFSHARFEPSGMTKNPEVRFAKSIVDYIFRWMATKFLSPEAQYRAGVNMREEPAEPTTAGERGSATCGAVARLQTGGTGTEEDLRVRGDAESGRRAAVQHLRLDHDPQRQLLQVRQLRHDVRPPFLRLESAGGAGPPWWRGGAMEGVDHLGRLGSGEGGGRAGRKQCLPPPAPAGGGSRGGASGRPATGGPASGGSLLVVRVIGGGAKERGGRVRAALNLNYALPVIDEGTPAVSSTTDRKTRVERLEQKIDSLHRTVLEKAVLQGLLPIRHAWPRCGVVAPDARQREQRFREGLPGLRSRNRECRVVGVIDPPSCHSTR